MVLKWENLEMCGNTWLSQGLGAATINYCDLEHSG